MFLWYLVGLLRVAIVIPHYISKLHPLLLSKDEGKGTAKKDTSPGYYKETILC